MTATMPHQFIERRSGRVVTEELIADRLVQLLYGPMRENAPKLFQALVSARSSQLLSYLQFDRAARRSPAATRKLAVELGIDLEECLEPDACLRSARHLFERQIQYWQFRPTPADPQRVVSPADAKMLVGSLAETDQLFVKEKFFAFDELLGADQPAWRAAFAGGSFALLRLTPEKYHYNHTPVAGRVVDLYALEGGYHSCNPAAVISMVAPFSKNKRVVTVFDTDVSDGTGVGLVAMVEIVALMIGDILQCYSAQAYDAPAAITPGMTVRRGQPKSLFRPGSSVVVLFFQKDRMHFDADLIANRRRRDVASRFSFTFGAPVVETDVPVRASIARSGPGPAPAWIHSSARSPEAAGTLPCTT
jgi:phosphatidylserine decarboxylase